MARGLSPGTGILEPMQTALSVDGQVEELRSLLEENAELPARLVGWSWGAWLAYILAARYPQAVEKLILVCSGPFEERYAADVMRTRLERLDAAERAEAASLLEALDNDFLGGTDRDLARFAELMTGADAYDPLPREEDVVECRYEVNAAVWKEAVGLRRSGALLRMGERIECKVVAMHGDYDPHPAAGVLGPLSRVIADFRFILLENCGHCPWLERQARGLFFSLLREELEE